MQSNAKEKEMVSRISPTATRPMVGANYFLAMLLNPRIREARLNALKMGILAVVYDAKEPPTVKDLAARLRVTAPAICRSLDELEGIKLVKRLRDKKDHRVVRLMTTPQGFEFISNINADLVAEVH